MRYRPEVDGLRAVALVPVVAFHAWPAVFRGGFAGVDIFFVISGFLITRLTEHASHDQFSIVDFYERRARRMLPALFVVILASLFAGSLWMIPSELQDLCQSIVACLGFAANYFFRIKRDGYFEHSTDIDPMVHTWTLSVEEQFYLLFPLLFAGLRRLGRRLMIGAIVLIVCASFAAALRAPNGDQSSFYLLPTRAWELGFGCLLAFLPDLRPRSRRLTTTAEVCGLAAIVVGFVSFDERTPWPGIATCLPVFGAGLILSFSSSDSALGRVLSQRAMKGIGLISYSVYLWHQPLLAFTRLRSFGEPSTARISMAVVASFVLGAASWRYVERPFRDRSRYSRGKIFAGFGMAAFATAAVGVLGHVQLGWPGRLSPVEQQLSNWSEWSGRIHDPRNGEDLVPNAERCWNDFTSAKDSAEQCTWGPERSPVIAVWGDSHSRPIAWGLQHVLRDANVRVRQLSQNRCIPVPTLARGGIDGACQKFGKEVVEQVATDPDVALVVVVANWDGLFDDDKNLSPVEPHAKLDEHARHEIIAAELLATMRALAERKQVVVMHTVPSYQFDVPRESARGLMLGSSLAEVRSTASKSHDAYLRQDSWTRDLLNQLSGQPNVLVVEPGQVFCKDVSGSRCSAFSENDVLYIDSNHLNFHGARLMARHVLASVEVALPTLLDARVQQTR